MVFGGHNQFRTFTRSDDSSNMEILPAFTRCTNPVQYDDLRGPRFVNLGMTLAKELPIKEKLKFELRLEGYNVMNALTGDNPVLDPNKASFGAIIQQRPGIFGHQIQYSGCFIF